MTPSRAKEVLEGMGADFDAASLYVYGQLHANKTTAHIGASLSADQLQAIALWMQDPESVVNA